MVTLGRHIADCSTNRIPLVATITKKIAIPATPANSIALTAAAPMAMTIGNPMTPESTQNFRSTGAKKKTMTTSVMKPLTAMNCPRKVASATSSVNCFEA